MEYTSKDRPKYKGFLGLPTDESPSKFMEKKIKLPKSSIENNTIAIYYKRKTEDDKTEWMPVPVDTLKKTSMTFWNNKNTLSSRATALSALQRELDAIGDAAGGAIFLTTT